MLALHAYNHKAQVYVGSLCQALGWDVAKTRSGDTICALSVLSWRLEQATTWEAT